MGFDMKWIVLAGFVGLITGCCTTSGVVEYRQVSVVPVKRVTVAPVVTQVRVVPVRPVVTRVVSPVVQPILVDYVEPVDVTTTTIDFY
jgi:hypothetical protein